MALAVLIIREGFDCAFGHNRIEVVMKFKSWDSLAITFPLYFHKNVIKNENYTRFKNCDSKFPHTG